jgi:LysM repeat protein
VNAHPKHNQADLRYTKKNKKGGSIMKTKRLVIAIIAAIIVAGTIVTPVYAQGTGTYIVQPGDTMLKIAVRHGIRVSQLAEANGLRWDSWVYVGQRLVIPTNTVYVVQRGDTLSSIARRYSTTVHAIMQANGLRDTRIYVGQRLTIPGTAPASSPVQDTVAGWTGRIVNLPAGSQHAYYFERSDGQGFGIGATDDLVGRRIEELRWTGEQFRVWGTLRTDVPSYGGRYIAVEHLEVVSEPVTEPTNLTSLASVSASSHLPTDRWGQYQSWMAVDGALGTAWAEGVAGAGVGEWIELRFPETIEVYSIILDTGYDKNADVFYKNNRIKRVTIIFSDGEHFELIFADRRGMQEMPLVRAPGPNIETTSIKIIIEEVFPGWKYDDTCLAEIEVWGRTK